jgi:oligosaccharide repeat unit polymerase
MTWMLIPMAFFLVMHVSILGKPLGRLSPTSIFIYMQFLMAIGTVPALEPLQQADTAHAWLILTTFLVFVVSSAILAFLASHPRTDTLSSLEQSRRWIRPGAGIILLCVLSILICLAYYSAIGYNVLAIGLGNAISGGTSDVTTLRLQAYAGDEYYYPGYVNQFKNSLLPALVCVIVPYLFVRNSSARWTVSLALIAVTTIFLLGTGQRGAFVVFAIVLAVFISLMNKRKSVMRMIVLVFITIPIFAVSTVALGRSSSQMDAAVGLLDKMGVLGSEIVFRILGSNQQASVAGFRYIYSRPQSNGAEWMQSLFGLLPGAKGSTLSNEIYASLFGSVRGTAPPSIWGSFFHNFGFQCTVLLTAFLAIAYHLISKKIAQTRDPNSLQAIGMAGVTAVLGAWVAGSPDYLLNVGIVVFIFLWRLGSAEAKRTSGDHRARAGLENVK